MFEVTPENWKRLLLLVNDQQAQIEGLKSALLAAKVLSASELEAAVQKERQEAASRVSTGVEMLDFLERMRREGR